MSCSAGGTSTSVPLVIGREEGGGGRDGGDGRGRK